MRDDLGTWPSDQAAVLVDILRHHGVDASADPVLDGARVTIAPEHAARATAVMSTSMEQIAAAATRTSPRPGPVDDEEGPPLVMERLRRLAPVLGVLVAALMVAVMVPGGFRIAAMVVALVVIAVAWVRGSRSDEDR